jgi:hypothetical protein
MIVDMADAGVFAFEPPLDPADILDEQQREAVTANVALLTENEAFKHLAIWIKSKRARFFLTVAEGLANSHKPVDQREIDYKRGFWAGANWFAHTGPHQAAAAFRRRQLDQAEEAE